MKRKLIKVLGMVLLLIVGVLVAVPFFLESKIGGLIKTNVNNNVNATLDFSDANLSLIRSFPKVHVGLTNVSMVNKAPFEGDTLFFAKEVALSMGLSELFKGEGEPISVQSLAIDGALLNIKVNTDEVANYDIAKETAEQEPQASDTDSGFTFAMERYKITDTEIRYNDLASKIQLVLTEMNHSGSGDLSAETSQLKTVTNALVSFGMDSTNYLNNHKVALEALIGIDLKENKYSFLENEALINQLPLVFNGFVKLNEDNQEVDIAFKTPSSDFRNFLALIPEAYAKNIETVETTGNFEVNGNFKGIVDEEHMPTFNVQVRSDNASFKYPDLPKAVRNVFMDVLVHNATGLVEDTFVDIKKVSFTIDQDKFQMTSKISDLMGNTKVVAELWGNMNLENLQKAYPMPQELTLKGLLNMDIRTAFDMASIENKQYEKTQTSGNMALSGFEYRSPDFPQPLYLQKTALTFNPKTVTLNGLKGTTGKTDFEVSGTINNLLGYMFNNEKVQGNFTMASNTFALNDFMVAVDETGNPGANGESGAAQEEQIKIPAFLDATFNATANTVLYDDITLSNVQGQLIIDDETAKFNNMTSQLFGGKVGFDGEVSTKQNVPTFAMKLNMDHLQIGETFRVLDLFEVLAPVASALKGNFSSDISLSGNLKNDFTPDLLSLSGQVLANVLANDISAESAPVLSQLAGKLDFINLKELDLKELKTHLSFKDGVVAVKPFTFNYKDIAINVVGSHTFDQKLDYKATLNVPAKYLGNEVTGLLAKLNDDSLKDLTIPVTANIGGGYTSPKVTTDLSSGVKDLTNQLIQVQKQKLMGQGKAKAKDLLGGILQNKEASATDSTDGKRATGTGVQEVLGGILTKDTGAKQDTLAKKDTLATQKDEVKEAAKDILGGLFGKKKAKKDSVN